MGILDKFKSGQSEQPEPAEEGKPFSSWEDVINSEPNKGHYDDQGHLNVSQFPPDEQHRYYALDSALEVKRHLSHIDNLDETDRQLLQALNNFVSVHENMVYKKYRGTD